jgi:hypothetical protein
MTFVKLLLPIGAKYPVLALFITSHIPHRTMIRHTRQILFPL